MGTTTYLFYLQSMKFVQHHRIIAILARRKIRITRQEMMADNIKRREFIGGLAAMSVAAKVPRGGGQSTNGKMPYRMEGKTGVKISPIGLGGFHLGLAQLEEPGANKIFHLRRAGGIIF